MNTKCVIIGSESSPYADAVLSFGTSRAAFTPNVDATFVSYSCSEYVPEQWRTSIAEAVDGARF